MPGNIPQLTSVCFIVSFYCLGKAAGANLDGTVDMATLLLMQSLHLLWELDCTGSGVAAEERGDVPNACASHWKGAGPAGEQLQDGLEKVAAVLPVTRSMLLNSLEVRHPSRVSSDVGHDACGCQKATLSGYSLLVRELSVSTAV